MLSLRGPVWKSCFCYLLDRSFDAVTFSRFKNRRNGRWPFDIRRPAKGPNQRASRIGISASSFVVVPHEPRRAKIRTAQSELQFPRTLFEENCERTKTVFDHSEI